MMRAVGFARDHAEGLGETRYDQPRGGERERIVFPVG
jgi:hypothetical protein